MADKSNKFVLEVPLDASGIKDFKPDRSIKVVAYNRQGATVSSGVAEFDKNGNGRATLGFKENPGGVRVVVGPDSASEEDLKYLQTLSVNVTASQLKEGTNGISAIVITPYYWDWWI